MFATPYSTLRNSLAEILLAVDKREGKMPIELFVASPTNVIYYGCAMGKMHAIPYRICSWLRNEVCQEGVLKTLFFIIRKIFDEIVLLKNHLLKTRTIDYSAYPRKWFHSRLESVVEEIVHKLFDEFVFKAYNARQRRIVHQVKLIEKSFNVSADENLRQRYYSYLSRDLRDSRAPITKWEQNLDEILEKPPLTRYDLVALKRLVTRVSEAVMGFWDNIISVNIHLGGYIHDPDRNWAVNDRGLYHALKKEQALINLEGHLAQPIPMIELIRLCHSESQLTETDRRTIQQWIEGLNEKMESTYSQTRREVINGLDVALKEIVNLCHIQGSFHLSLAQLMVKLDNKGCKLLRLSNDQFLAWRSTLKPGMEVKCNGIKFTLGKRLSPEDSPNDRYVVYELEGCDWVMQIADNRYVLSVDQLKIEQHQAIPHVKLIDNIAPAGCDPISGLDENGKCVILEKLGQPLSETLDWKSTGPIPVEDDFWKVEILSSLFLGMYEARAWPVEWVTPEEVSSRTMQLRSVDNRELVTKSPRIKDLMWTRDRILRAIRLIVMERGFPLGTTDNYLAAESLCVELANKNPHILKFLMKVSKYYHHPIPRFYREQIKEKFQKGNFTILDASLPFMHNKPFYIERLNHLFTNIQTLRNRSLDLVKLQFRKRGLTREQVEQFCREGSFFVEEKADIRREMERLYREFDHLDRTIETLKNEKNERELELVEKQKVEQKGLEFSAHQELLKLTVFGRFLEIYLASPTAGIISESIVEDVVKSFQEGFQPGNYDDDVYYAEVRAEILRKNKLARDAGVSITSG